ncbi:MAG: RagB/SusD family nutrient uptake outer membrane protein [Prolixibacteraceae bacterium]
MKKYIYLAMLTVILASCEDNFLDKAPESGLTEEEVFSKYENFQKFFNVVYDGTRKSGNNWYNYNIRTAFPLYFNFWDQKFTWETTTDAADAGRFIKAQTFKSGQVSSFINMYTYDITRRPLLGSMFMSIRICNLALKNVTRITDATDEDINDLIAQAYFVRAFCHFELMRVWGPMPYMRDVIGPEDEWDLPRLSKYETLENVALDMDSAVIYFEKAGRMRRDLGPGQAGHLNHPDQARPTGVAAKAYKGRALLYAASPLNNDDGQTAWENAAKANWDAIQTAEQYSYALLTAADYKLNFVGTKYTNEQLWAWSAGTKTYNAGDLAGLMNGVFASNKGANSGVCPTQNFVDKFETKWGDPLNTEAERQAASAQGHYEEQDPYKDRDPRFYLDIIYNSAPIPGYGTAKIYYEIVNGTPRYSELLDQTYVGITRTGYYLRKIWGEQSVKNKTTPQYTDPLIRLAELYLNYAEAANEAYGPNTAAPGATMSAVQAINVIRNRIGMPDIRSQLSSDKETFRERIKNERNIELCFEGHYYHDIRRWKDAPNALSGTLIGMDIEKVPVNPSYPTGYKYTRLPLPANRQPHWKDAMYYLPFNTEDNFKMKNFIPNEVW